MEVGIKILFAVMFALVITMLYCAIIVGDEADDRERKIREDRVMTNTTPVPAPELTTNCRQLSEWTRYPVPLDDDLQRYIEELCREYEVPSSVVMAVIETESNYDPMCVGDEGHSYGLMQIWEECHKDRMKRLNVENLLDAKQNVAVGVDFLAELIDHFEGDIEMALSFYNGSGGVVPNTYAHIVMKRAEQLLESSQHVTEVVG